MSDHGAESEDWRLQELRRLGEAERRLTTELADTRDAIARLVVQLLPPHAPATRIELVVRASGYGRWMIDRMRQGKLWLDSARRELQFGRTKIIVGEHLVSQVKVGSARPFVPPGDRQRYGLLARGWHGDLRITSPFRGAGQPLVVLFDVVSASVLVCCCSPVCLLTWLLGEPREASLTTRFPHER